MNDLDEFAKAALTGLLASQGQIPGTEGYDPEGAAKQAYRIARAMLIEREKNPEEEEQW